MTDIKDKIQNTQVSLKAFVSLLLTIIFVVVTFFDQLPPMFMFIIGVLLVLDFIAPFLGVKKLDAKEAFSMVLESIRNIKAANPNGEFKLLESIESGITFLVQFWDKVNTMLKKVK